jgi:predicted RND superfamily exporter protein
LAEEPRPAPEPGAAAWLRPARMAAALSVAISFALVLFVVDLTPRVESEFFFSSEDPQLRGSREIAAQFPSRDQLLVAAAGNDLASPEYLARIAELTEGLAAIPGIEQVQSLTRGPASPKSVATSPIWSRLLLGRDQDMTLLIATLAEDADRPAVVAAAEGLMAAQAGPDFRLDASGVPWVVEMIRRALARDLKLFSLVALLAFGALIALVYRSAAIFAGALLSCLGSCAVTLALLWAFKAPIGLLTANIVTIVFVICLSHVVFLTANARAELARAAPEERPAALGRAVAITWQASTWCTATTGLGFASLLFSSAKPLRELGFAGSIGTVAALLVPYALYPAFLARAGRGRSIGGGAARALPGRPRAVYAGVALLLALAALPLLPRLDTDPSLLSYFAPGGSLYRGLERIDHHGGSSPLLLVVADPEGGKLDGGAAPARLDALQKALEKDPAVGSSLALPLLLAEARQNPLAMYFSPSQVVDLLMGPNFGQVGRGFLSEDRRHALYLLRMREGERAEPRRRVIERLAAEVSAAGLRLERQGGLYELQASLGELVARSLVEGLGGLLLLFLGIAWAVARSPRGMAAMILCLLLVPLLLLGSFAALGWPLDFISSPAANVAIGMGIDSMIHLVLAVRRRLAAGDGAAAAWAHARSRLWPAILGGAGILAAGFALFAFSSFPPTQRFGVAVAVGTLAAAGIALLVLPVVAGAPREAAGQP